MWAADMDMEVSECVRKALHEYVDPGVSGYVSVILDEILDEIHQDLVCGEDRRLPLFFSV